MTVRSRAVSTDSPNSLFKCKTADEILPVYTPVLGLQKDVSLQWINGRGSSSTSCGQYEKSPANRSSPQWTYMEFCFKWHLPVAAPTFSPVFQEVEFPVRIPKGQHSSTKVQPWFQWLSQPTFYRDYTPFILNLQVPRTIPRKMLLWFP